MNEPRSHPIPTTPQPRIQNSDSTPDGPTFPYISCDLATSSLLVLNAFKIEDYPQQTNTCPFSMLCPHSHMFLRKILRRSLNTRLLQAKHG